MITDCKTCRKCGETKPLDEMKKHRRKSDGVDDICLICHAKQDAAYNKTPNGKAYKFLRNTRSQCKKKGIPNPINELKYLQWAIPYAYGVDSIKIGDLPEFVFLNSNMPVVEVEPEEYVYVPSDEKFIPSNSDGRKKVSRSVAVRNHKFRKELFKIHGIQCMISNCKVKSLIQGAHIHEYRDDKDDHETNGLLLRMDFHRLYDMNLLSINPFTYQVVICESVLKNDPEYVKYNGVTLKFNTDCSPDHDALVDRWNQYQKNPGVKYKNKVFRQQKNTEMAI